MSALAGAYADLGAVDHWGFDGSGPGTTIGEPMFVDSIVGGLAAATDGDDGFVVSPRLSSRTDEFSVAFWLLPTAGTATGDVLRWGSTPGVGVVLNGGEGAQQPGTATIWVRLSNGSHPLRWTTPEPLSPDQWHLLAVTVRPITVWGGVEAVAYVGGEQVAAGRYSGGLFDWVNMRRPSTLTVLAGGASAAVDEMAWFDRRLTPSDVARIAAAGPADTSAARYGWGVVF